nr:ROK family protein [uncultured Flavonifractor sp.]
MQKALTSAALKQTNRRRIYQYVYQSQKPVTKQEIAGALELSLPTVSNNLNSFLEEGLLAYSGTQASTGGRKPRTVALVADARFSVGISIMDDTLRMAVIDIRAQELGYQKIRKKFSHTPDYYRDVANLLETFLDRLGLDRQRLLGLGITVPGIVDAERERLVFAPTLDLRDIPLCEITAAFSAYPVRVDNDANASGYAEAWARRENRNLVYLSLERGVGGAILMGERPYTGDNGRSGEFGHICVVPNGRPCRCGKRGCLEAYCSTSRLSDDLGITLEEFFSMLKSGNQQIALTWEQYRGHLTDGLAIIRMGMDCDIVLGGMLAAYLDEHLDQIRQEVCEKTLFDQDGRFLILDYFKSHSACVGVALHDIDCFLSSF